MPNTYTQLYIHIVFVVKYRDAMISPLWEDRLHHYIIAIIQNNGHKVLAINSVPDHLHLFIGLNPKQSLSELMRLVKGDSSEFINKEKLTKFKFNWQSGYAAFTNSQSQIDRVVQYIRNQKEHHKRQSFQEEYISFLDKYKIQYEKKFLFSELI